MTSFLAKSVAILFYFLYRQSPKRRILKKISPKKPGLLDRLCFRSLTIAISSIAGSFPFVPFSLFFFKIISTESNIIQCNEAKSASKDLFGHG